MAHKTTIPRTARSWDTVDEVCARLELPKSTAYDLITHRVLPATQTRPGACWRVNRKAVEELAERMDRELMHRRNGPRS